MKRLITVTLLLSLLLCGCGKEEVPTAPAVTDAPTAAPTEYIPEDQEAVTEPTEAPVRLVRRLVRMASLDENGQERWFREYGYDGLGRQASEREASQDGFESYRATYAYEGNICTVTYESAGGTTEVTVRVLDDQGRLLRQQSAMEGEEPYMVTEYTYDDFGNQLTCTLTLEGEVSRQAYSYTYTPAGKVETVEETMDGAFVSRTAYVYDDQGRVLETTVKVGGDQYSTVHVWEGSTETITQLDSEDALMLTTIHTYDDQGNLLRDETHQDGEVISCAEYTYEDLEIPEN